MNLREHFTNIYKKIWSFRKIEFIENVSKVAFGNLIGQVLSLISITLLTRIFDKAEIGTYYVFLSYVAIIGIVSLFSYHVLLPGADDRTTKILTNGMLIILIFVAILSSLFFKAAGYTYYIYIGFMITAGALNQLSTMLNLRNQKFKIMVFERIISPTVNITLFLYLWQVNVKTASSIIWGTSIFAFVISIIYFLISGFEYLRPLCKFKDIKEVLLKNFKNPLLLTPGDLLNTFSYNLPTLIIEKYFGIEWVAQYNIVLKFCNAPMTLICDVISKVYLSNLGNSLRVPSISMYDNYLKLYKYLSVMGVAFALGIATAYPLLFDILLGDGWDIAGKIVIIFAPMYGLMFIQNPLSMTYYIFNQQKYILKMQLLYFFISVISFSSGIYFNNIWLAFIMFSSLSCLRYMMMLYKVKELSFRIKELAHSALK